MEQINTTPVGAPPAPPTIPQTENKSLPNFPCPNCGENLLTEGFYNYCTETSSLREDNYTHVVNDRLYIDHDEHGHETVDHECDMEARCQNCDEELPWALYQLRGMDGEKLTDLPAMIDDLLAELNDDKPAASVPQVSAAGEEQTI
jgi:transcription initiation factor IIE alpha subunit